MLAFLEMLLQKMPLELFVVMGAFLEEIIAPIPSPFIMTTAAVAAVEQGYTWFPLVVLVLLAAAGKTIASWIVYVIADKSEDVILGKYGKYFGVSHAQVEKMGALFSKGWWDDVTMLVLRSLPIVPTFLVSVMAGVIKLNIRTYLITTFIGTVVRNTIYLAVGIYGFSFLGQAMELVESNRWWLLLLGVIVGGGIIVAIKLKERLQQKFF